MSQHWNSPRLTEDLSFTLVDGPPEYPNSTDGPVEYVVVANTVGVVGYLWASVASDAAGVVQRDAAGSEGFNAMVAWVARLRDARARELAPAQALAELAEYDGGPYMGRAVPGERYVTGSLDNLESLAKTGWRLHPKPADPRSPGELREEFLRKAAEKAARKKAGPQHPPLTYAQRVRARTRPGGWIVVPDPAFAEDSCPAYGEVGRWQVDHQGVPVRYLPNSDHLPSPLALGMREPENAVEAAVQRFAAEHLAKEDLLPVLLDAPLTVRVAAEAPGLYLEANRYGGGEVSAYTSGSLVPAGWSEHRVLTGRQIAAMAPGAVLALNPGQEPDASVGLAALRRLDLARADAGRRPVSPGGGDAPPAS
ncbi:hypothetical protein GCM10010441_66040 [Kitasatospora paracochleata]|uniref:Type III secretion system (T3SS) SseB-like protein n=1 Tax=Kitasatospora paracochleata TaxID=58354 RepID=A0ABT1IZZ6_9ACTN|nr:type VII secretion system-associated protein [Kitasatospora paracochleata]MCP2310740.1 hypothetical protein [Kitasatospora paracochleata]